MLDIKFIRENVDQVKWAVEVKQMGLDIDALLKLDGDVQKLKVKQQDLQTQRNAHSKKIPKASAEERPALIEQGREIGAELDKMKPEVSKLEQELLSYLYQVPQIPDANAPLGKDESENVEIKKAGTLPNFEFKPWDHVQLLEAHKWADFEKIAQVSGSRSYSLRNEMVLLEMAMHRLALEVLSEKGFTLASTPSLCREGALLGTGHFPTGRDQVYHMAEDDLYLSGTAEVQLNSLHQKEIIEEKDLPILYAGYSPCFRREAGSYGRDVRGLIRVHQFMKVEQFVICPSDPEESKKWHQKLLQTSEEIVEMLELPYRVIECCTGDMGAGKVKMFDIEAWVPSEEKYRETHSCSALHDWQARRTNTRYRDSSGEVKFCHTLNNTAVATPRTLVPLLENHQMADGRINIPKALRPYMGGAEVLGTSVRS